MRRLAILVMCALGAAAVGVAGLGGVGYSLYSRSHVDPMRHVDAIIVLGGDRDGREEYGIELARQGVSANVVLSQPYGRGDRKVAEFCAIQDQQFTVTCVPPQPSTTRGEALFTRDLAVQHGWNSVMVISWRYHLPRARYIFSRCFDGDIVMRPVPRDYEFSVAHWEYIYLYQTVGFVKAFFQGRC
ncbi:MAG: YdcF family protein [Rhodococcus sp. (in: high G+C Gram-positive bacteria)]|nr:MAG: YdcF family protein [Rhodococcus sp. (in: high G+C Gram-positive bacteria)]